MAQARPSSAGRGAPVLHQHPHLCRAGPPPPLPAPCSPVPPSPLLTAGSGLWCLHPGENEAAATKAPLALDAQSRAKRDPSKQHSTGTRPPPSGQVTGRSPCVQLAHNTRQCSQKTASLLGRGVFVPPGLHTTYLAHRNPVIYGTGNKFVGSSRQSQCRTEDPSLGGNTDAVKSQN